MWKEQTARVYRLHKFWKYEQLEIRIFQTVLCSPFRLCSSSENSQVNMIMIIPSITAMQPRSSASGLSSYFFLRTIISEIRQRISIIFADVWHIGATLSVDIDTKKQIKTRGWRCFIKHKTHTGRHKCRKMPFFVPGDLDFDFRPWPSNSSERGTKHVFRVNFAQIRSAVPEIFHTQTKTQTDGAKNRTFRSSLRAVIIREQLWNPVDVKMAIKTPGQNQRYC